MNNMKLTLVLMFLVMIIAVMNVDAHGHFEMNGCQCQHGGERGGHCHCPWWAKMDTYCRAGSNHWVCFPFGR
jgi:hypothetical protein